MASPRIWRLAALAGLLLTTPRAALAEGATVDAATPAETAAAQAAFADADALFDVQRYEEAIAAYRRSFAIVASPNSRLMVARSLQELGRLAEAYREYAATLADAEALTRDHESYAQTASAARHELEALKSRVAWLTVELGDVPAEATITVAGVPVPADTRAEPLVVVPGRVDVVATAPDGRTARARVHLAAGRERSVTLKLDETVTVGEAPVAETAARDPEPGVSAPRPAVAEAAHEPRFPVAALAATAVGLVGFAGFGLFGAQSRKQFDDLEAACPDDACPEDYGDEIDAGRRQQLLANVGLAIGVAGVGAGVTLFVVGRAGHADRPQATLRIDTRGVRVQGSFQ